MILVCTGITGSLGKAILKEQELLRANRITKIIGLSRDEQKQIALQREYNGNIPLRLYLGDVTDRERMKFAFKNANFVIHCAAQKDVPKFESDVPTGYKTNILGTQYVSEAFMDSFNAISGIMLSTDKAVMPTTTYGISKLAAQQLWLWHTKYQKSVKMGAVTYGNVWGSRGSVIEAWTEKAKLGIPFLITDMSCTRYFMRIQDAAQFVLNSLFNNESKVHVPKMKSANMVDVAEVIWRHWQPNKALLMEVTGLRGTEKLHEALTTNGDSSETCEKFTAAELDQMYREWLKG